MLAPSKLLVLLFAVTLGACAASRAGKRAHSAGGDTYGTSINGTTSADAVEPGRSYAAQSKTGQSRSFEAVAEVAPGAVAENYGSANKASSDQAPEPPADAAPKPVAHYVAPAPPVTPEGGQPPVRQPVVAEVSPGEMLVYTANLTMAVYQVEQGLAVVERVARELDGYLATRADLAITIRVPRAKFEIALKAIEGSGDVVHRDIKAEDVTDEFFDTEVRARNARAMRDRLAKLLQQAAVKEALEIEKELARVTQEIELLEGKLKLLRHRIAYSTINVTFRPREIAINNRPTRLPFPWLEQLGLRNLLRLDEGE